MGFCIGCIIWSLFAKHIKLHQHEYSNYLCSFLLFKLFSMFPKYFCSSSCVAFSPTWQSWWSLEPQQYQPFCLAAHELYRSTPKGVGGRWGEVSVYKHIYMWRKNVPYRRITNLIILIIHFLHFILWITRNSCSKLLVLLLQGLNLTGNRSLNPQVLMHFWNWKTSCHPHTKSFI